MAWGDILTQVATAVNPTLGAGVGFFSNILQERDLEKKKKQQENEYYAALAQQKQLAQVAAQTAADRAAWERSMKERIITQTGTMGDTMRAAQTAMGAMPQYNQDTVNQDYARTKSGMMSDFTDMLKLVESQGRSDQITRLGGAGSTAADDSRMNALIKRYSPELINIDNQAYGAAVDRATNNMNLLNTNRTNTLNELKGLYEPQISAETQLLSQGGTDMTAPTNLSANYLNTIRKAGEDTATAAGKYSTNISDNLGVLLAEVFNKNRTTPGINPSAGR